MEDNNNKTVQNTDGGSKPANPQPGSNRTTMNHPALPPTVTLVERIFLPPVFALVASLPRSPQTKDALRSFFEPLRDALIAAYPPDTSAGGDLGTQF